MLCKFTLSTKVDRYILIKILFKKFVYERRERYFKIELYPFHKKNLSENFCQVLFDSLVSADMDI